MAKGCFGPQQHGAFCLHLWSPKPPDNPSGTDGPGQIPRATVTSTKQPQSQKVSLLGPGGRMCPGSWWQPQRAEQALLQPPPAGIAAAWATSSKRHLLNPGAGSWDLSAPIWHLLGKLGCPGGAEGSAPSLSRRRQWTETGKVREMNISCSVLQQLLEKEGTWGTQADPH